MLGTLIFSKDEELRENICARFKNRIVILEKNRKNSPKIFIFDEITETMAMNLIKNLNPTEGSVFNINSEFVLKNQNNFEKPFRIGDLFRKMENFMNFLKKNVVFIKGIGEFNFRDRFAVADGENIPLTEKENELLSFIYKNKKVSKEKILKTLWKRENDENTKVLETILYGLKHKFRERPTAKNLIVFSDGYYKLGGEK
ncbi:MAG: winged helix-turn-helix domain-containing protein [Rickettsiales bacterium]|jgi:hypothetical protein|nr:winged helix-turn-helix domain-containing protein [Rickettsiales bacterium]